VIKRLFYIVVSFWLVKKYVLPYFEQRNAQGESGEE
jgi:hypothetical protein